MPKLDGEGLQKKKDDEYNSTRARDSHRRLKSANALKLTTRGLDIIFIVQDLISSDFSTA